MKKHSLLLRAVSVTVALSLLLCVSSCDESEKNKRPVNISGNYSSEAESQPELPPFVDTEVDDRYNLARVGTAFADSVSSDYFTYTPDMINDGDMLTRWLSGSAGTEEEPSYFGIDWEESQRFDVVIIHWGTAHPAEGGFTVEITPADDMLTREGGSSDTVSSEEGELPYTIVRRGTENDDGQNDIIVFREPVNAESIRILCTEPYYSEEYGMVKYTPSCYEIMIYNSEDVESGVVSQEDVIFSDIAAITEW